MKLCLYHGRLSPTSGVSVPEVEVIGLAWWLRMSMEFVPEA